MGKGSRGRASDEGARGRAWEEGSRGRGRDEGSRGRHTGEGLHQETGRQFGLSLTYGVAFPAMATTKETRQWHRWAGTVEDIDKATRLAIEIIGQTSHTDTPCEIEIAYPQRVTNADSPDALQTEIDTRDLELIRSIRIAVGTRLGFRATIHVERKAPALTVEVIGEDRTRVEGLISQLKDLLGRGRQWPTGASTDGGIALVLMFSIVIITGLTWDAVTKSEGKTEVDSPIEYAVLIFVVLLAISVFLVVPWILPDLQLLKPGERTRLRRFRLAAIGFVGSVGASLLASVIYTAVQQ
jgi:hypothetical protein